MTQYVVVAFLDGTLTVDGTGPYRSYAKAHATCEALNDAGEWSEDSENATLVAQVVELRPFSELLADMRDQERLGT